MNEKGIESEVIEYVTYKNDIIHKLLIIDGNKYPHYKVHLLR